MRAKSCKNMHQAYTDNEGLDQPAHLQSEQGLHCPLTKSLSTTEYMYIKAWMILCTCIVWSDSAHFTHVQRYFFAWLGPYYVLCLLKYKDEKQTYQTHPINFAWQTGTAYCGPPIFMASEMIMVSSKLASEIITVYVLKFQTFYSKLFYLNFASYATVSQNILWNGKQCRPWSDCSHRSFLIWVCTVSKCHFARLIKVLRPSQPIRVSLTTLSLGRTILLETLV